MRLPIDRYIKLANQTNFATPIYGIARSLIAISLLMTLVFNSTNTLFDINQILNKGLSTLNGVGLNRFTIFNLFGIHIFLSKIICILILLFVISGYFPQITGILHWWVTYSFVTNGVTIDGGDQIAPIILLLLIPFCIFDTRNNHWKRQNPSIKISPVVKQILLFSYFLIRLQVFIIYFHAAVAKFQVEEWLNGTVLWYWTNEPMLGPSGIVYKIFHSLFENTFLLPIATWATLIIELFIAASIISTKRIKKTALKVGIIFHLFIFLFFGLPTFALIMIASLIIFLHPIQEKFKILKYEI